MARSNIYIDPRELRRYERKLRHIAGALPKVTARALNSAVGPARTQIKRDVAAALAVPQKHIKPRLWPAKASRKALRAGLVAGTVGVSIIHAGARERKGTVSYRSRSGRVALPDAFIAEPGGNRHVFRRKGAERYPIELVRTESPSAAMGPAYGQQLLQGARRRFASRMKVETKLLLSGQRR